MVESVGAAGGPHYFRSEEWQLKIDIKASSRESLVGAARNELSRALEHVKRGELPPACAGGGGGSGGSYASVNIDVVSPIKNRIAELRAKADELEAQLNSGGHGQSP